MATARLATPAFTLTTAGSNCLATDAGGWPAEPERMWLFPLSAVTRGPGGGQAGGGGRGAVALRIDLGRRCEIGGLKVRAEASNGALSGMRS